MDNVYNVATDKKEKIKLESRIVSADWLSVFARGGTEALLRVKTVFVAEGSSIEIKGISSEGKSPPKIKGKIFNNEFIGKLPIPEKVKIGAEVWFEAKLPKHGLKMESDTAIPAKPPILVSTMCWNKDTVKRGDIVKLTCQFESGVQDGENAVFVIYEHNPNSYDFKVTSFQTTIKNNKAEAMWAFDYHDDTSQIPHHHELKQVGKSYAYPQYFFIVVVDDVRIGVKRESGLIKFKDWVDHTVCEAGQPLKNEKIKVVFADGSEKELTTDSNGVIQLDEVSPGTVKFDLVNDDKLREDEKALLQQFSDENITEEQPAEAVSARDDSCDDGHFGPDPEMYGRQSAGTSADLENTYDHEFLHEEQERPAN